MPAAHGTAASRNAALTSERVSCLKRASSLKEPDDGAKLRGLARRRGTACCARDRTKGRKGHQRDTRDGDSRFSSTSLSSLTSLLSLSSFLFRPGSAASTRAGAARDRPAPGGRRPPGAGRGGGSG